MKDINIHIPGGSMVAIVGFQELVKSTLGKPIMPFMIFMKVLLPLMVSTFVTYLVKAYIIR